MAVHVRITIQKVKVKQWKLANKWNTSIPPSKVKCFGREITPCPCSHMLYQNWEWVVCCIHAFQHQKKKSITYCVFNTLCFHRKIYIFRASPSSTSYDLTTTEITGHYFQFFQSKQNAIDFISPLKFIYSLSTRGEPDYISDLIYNIQITRLIRK